MPIKTRAAVAFGPHEPLRLCEIEVADPGPGEVMVRLLATGLCHSDLHVIEGDVPDRFPIVLGHEGCGDVIAVGEGVSDFAPGDRVIPYLLPDCGSCDFCQSGRTNFCAEFIRRRQAGWTPFSLDGQPIASFMGLGTFAEVTVVRADMLVKANTAAAPDQACCIGCGVTTGIGAATITAELSLGSSAVVFGAGGVGLSVVQGARIAGAATIIAIDRNPAKEAVARALGATHFLDPAVVPDVAAEVIRLTGSGADAAFDCVGSPLLTQQALACVNPAWGLAVNVGVYRSGTELSVPAFSLATGRRWTGSLMGGAKRQDVARFVDMFVDGAYDLDRLVSHRLRPDEINRGFDMMRSGEAVRSVVVYS